MCGKTTCRRGLEALPSGGCNECRWWVVFVEYMVPAEARASLAKAKTVSVKRSLDSGRDGADHGVRGGRLSKSGKKHRLCAEGVKKGANRRIHNGELPWIELMQHIVLHSTTRIREDYNNRITGHLQRSPTSAAPTRISKCPCGPYDAIPESCTYTEKHRWQNT
jgi:hypothetical protein